MKYFRSDCIMTGTREWIYLTFNSTGLMTDCRDALMEECVRMMQQNLRQAPTMKKRAKSVYQQRNLGTIRERKKEKKEEPEPTSEQTIMRILRMRYFEAQSLISHLLTQSLSDQERKILLPSRYKYQSQCKRNRNSERERQKKGRRNVLHRQ